MFFFLIKLWYWEWLYLELCINKYVKFQLKKLGVMPPEQPLPVKCNRIYQIIWANNGDAISRQYAGTAALKVRGKELSILILNSELLEFYLQWRILLCKNSQMFCLFSSWTPVWPFSRRTFCIMLGVKWGRLECLGVLCHRWL